MEKKGKTLKTQKNLKTGKTAAVWIAGILLFVLVCKGLDFLYVTYDPWHRILFHSYYEQEQIDNLFIGSSHVFCDVDPALLDTINGQRNFNLATPGQRWDDTYYLLKDALDRYGIGHVYIECYYMLMTEHEIWTGEGQEFKTVDYNKDPANFQYPWMITYEMRPSAESLAIQLHAADKAHLPETIFPFVRYRANLFDREAVGTNIREKTGEDYLGYHYHTDLTEWDGTPWCQEYREKGFFYSNGVLTDREKNILQTRDLSVNGIGEESSIYIRKTLELCRSKGVEVTLFISPVYDVQLLSTVDYDRYLCSLREMVADYQVPLYDFNLVREDVLSIKEGKYFMDAGHLNTAGAELFTPVLWQVVTGTPEENADRFYASYEERLHEEEPEIYGLYFKETDLSDIPYEDGTLRYMSRQYTIAGNREDMEYRIACIPADAEETGEEEWSWETIPGNEFTLPTVTTGLVVIEGTCGDGKRRITIDIGAWN